jgi:hypothetical protein
MTRTGAYRHRRTSRRWTVSGLVLLSLSMAQACDRDASGDMGRMLSWLPQGTANAGTLSGTITLDEYEWFGPPNHLGIIQIDLATGKKRRFLQGRNPRRSTKGTTVFLQGCGNRVSRVARADSRGLIRVITPCSSELKNPGYSPTNFGFARLSPDEKRVAVEALYYIDKAFSVSTVVYDVGGKQLAIFNGNGAPTWTPAGRLLVTGEGLYLADRDLTRLERIDRGQINGPVNNPDVHPSGKRIVFEYNQQIWEMNLDGSNLRERVHGEKQLRYPTYSPDGKSIVYLATPDGDKFDKALYFTNLETGKSSHLDLSKVLANHSVSVVPNGPLSWTR